MPVKNDSETTYYGLFAYIGQQDYIFKEEDYYEIAPKGKFFWYYPGTTLIPPDSFRDDYSSGSEKGKEVMRELLRIAIAKAKTGDYQRLFALDYDVLQQLNFMDAFTVVHEEDSPENQYDDRDDQQRSTDNDILIQQLIRYGILGGQVAANAGAAAGYLIRLFSLIPDEKMSMVIACLETNNYFKLLIAISKNIPASDIGIGLAFGRLLSQKIWVGQSAEDSKYDDSIHFKLGKDKDGKYFFVNMEYVPMSGQPNQLGFVFKQIHDESFSSQSVVAQSAVPISPFTLLYVETVNEQGETQVQLMSALELAFVGTMITENLENEQLLGEIFSVIDIVLVVASLIAPVAAFWRMIGSFGLHYLIRYGARIALREMLKRALLKTGRKIVGRLFLEALLVGIAIFRKEIEELPYGKEFMASYDVFMLCLVAYDMRKFFVSGLLAPMLLQGRKLISALRGVNDLLAGKMINFINHLEAWAATRIRWRQLHASTNPQLVDAFDNPGHAFSEAEQTSLDAIYRDERARITQNSILSTLGKTGGDVPELIRVIDN
ncbi:MAG: hypothetical protein M3R17_10220, partial [Bacteroidota bacterium]|nr:hypothetical protein [Bacteroidota bacterium]